MAYVYRDLEFFKLRILAIHEAKYAFTVVTRIMRNRRCLLLLMTVTPSGF